MLVEFGRWFYIGHIPWFRNGFMSLIFLWEAYIHDMLYGMICMLLWLRVWILWMRSYLHNLHLEVCVEGHDTGYDLHGFSCSWSSSWMFGFHLHWIWDWLEIMITSLCSCMSCERWHVIPLSLSSVGCGELGRVLETWISWWAFSFPTLGLLGGLLLERYSPWFLSVALYLCLSFMDMDLELWYMS